MDNNSEPSPKHGSSLEYMNSSINRLTLDGNPEDTTQNGVKERGEGGGERGAIPRPFKGKHSKKGKKGGYLSVSDPGNLQTPVNKHHSCCAGSRIPVPSSSSSSSSSAWTVGTSKHKKKSSNRRNSDSSPQQGEILPYGLRVQHAAHKCAWSGSDSNSTPSAAGSGSYYSPGSVASGEQSSTSGRKTTDSASSSQKRRSRSSRPKYEAYMPLCEVQQALKKGEVLEGVLRINPRNYEDAYISAPDGQMDIYIGGLPDRNRAYNGDVVAVRLHESNKWKIHWDKIKDWEDESGTSMQNFLDSFTDEKEPSDPVIPGWNDLEFTVRPSDTIEFRGLNEFVNQVQKFVDEVKPKKKKKNPKNSRVCEIIPEEMCEVDEVDLSCGVSDIKAKDLNDDIDFISGNVNCAEGIESDFNSVNDELSKNVDKVCKYDTLNAEVEKLSIENNQDSSFNISYFNLSDHQPNENISSDIIHPPDEGSGWDGIKSSQVNDPPLIDNWTLKDEEAVIIFSPEELLEVPKIEAYPTKEYFDSDDDCGDNRGAVPPHELSGDDILFSESDESVDSVALDQHLEDMAFLRAAQDAQNNNVQVVDLNSLSHNDIAAQVLPSNPSDSSETLAESAGQVTSLNNEPFSNDPAGQVNQPSCDDSCDKQENANSYKNEANTFPSLSEHQHDTAKEAKSTDKASQKTDKKNVKNTSDNNIGEVNVSKPTSDSEKMVAQVGIEEHGKNVKEEQVKVSSNVDNLLGQKSKRRKKKKNISAKNDSKDKSSNKLPGEVLELESHNDQNKQGPISETVDKTVVPTLSVADNEESMDTALPRGELGKNTPQHSPSKNSKKSKNRRKEQTRYKGFPEGPSAVKTDEQKVQQDDSFPFLIFKHHPQWRRFVQKTGKIIAVIEQKNSRKMSGYIRTLQDNNTRYALFAPVDHRFPRVMVAAETCPPGFFDRPQDFKNQLFLAEVVKWDPFSNFPQGVIKQILGISGSVETETAAILQINNVDDSDFPPNITEDLDASPTWKIPEAEVQQRRDFRSECVFTIDPKTARDLDDALSCKVLDDGLLEVGVHIADVSYFVKPGSKLDHVARNRATSVYLVQKVVPMLPSALCEHLCSLNPGEDKLTFSVVWKMTQECQIVDCWFGRTIIHSCCKLSYEQVQDVIEHPDKNWEEGELPKLYGNFKYSDITSRVHMLQKLALILRSRRFESGALRLDQVRIMFSLNQNYTPMGFDVYEHKDSNRLVEEFMLLANMAVAHRLYKFFPKIAFLRSHPPPDESQMTELSGLCSAVGVTIDTSSAGSLQESLNQVVGSDDLSRYRLQVLTHLFSKPMRPAVYFCAGKRDDPSSFAHYALNVPLYTHFTSPIRRYPDIIVHRMLAASLGYEEPPSVGVGTLQKIADHCNDKKLASKVVHESSCELFLYLFVKEIGSLEDKGMVVAVLEHSFDILSLRVGVVKRVYCNKLGLTRFNYFKSKRKPLLNLFYRTESDSEIVLPVSIFTLLDIVITAVPEEMMKFQVTIKPPSNAVLC